MSGANHKQLGIIAFLAGLVCEAVAVLPVAAPEVPWVTPGQSIPLHLLAALLSGGGSAALFTSGRGVRQWVGPAFLFALLASLVPVVGCFAVLVLALIVVSHHAQAPEPEVDLVPVPAGSEAAPQRRALHGPGPLPMPLAGLLPQLAPAALQEIVLGLESLPPARTRPILHRLQKHPDVRVQLYANGLLNDHLDQLERRLAVLKQRVAMNRRDLFSQLAIVETYSDLFRNGLVAPDEVALVAGQALEEAEAVLALEPAHAVALEARVDFLLRLGEHREAGLCIEQLFPLPGQQGRAARLQARLLFEQAAAAPVPQPTPPLPARRQDRAAGS